jgi:ABC-type uncharacterized transport system auxiliary subunit
VIRAQLIDSATGRVLGTKTFHALTPAATEDPYGGVKAMSQPLRGVLDEIVAFVSVQPEVQVHSPPN